MANLYDDVLRPLSGKIRVIFFVFKDILKDQPAEYALSYP